MNRSQHVSVASKLKAILTEYPIICPPMVRGSELAFRMMVRSHSIKICYSPMIKSELIVKNIKSELDVLETCEKDNPLIVQVCGRAPSVLEQTAHVIRNKLPNILAIDFNLGCPQECAQKGKYGAFLLEEPALSAECVKALCKANLPVFCKIRISQDVKDTIAYAKMLQEAGCSILAVHCRLRKDKHWSIPDYTQAKALVDELYIPVIANGGINSRAEAKRVMEQTGTVGVMIASALLANPRLADGNSLANAEDLADEYIDYCEKYPPPEPKYIRKHFRWMFRSVLKPGDEWYDIRGKQRVIKPEIFHCPDRWKVILWQMMEKPTIKTMWQFRQIINFYTYHKNLNLHHNPSNVTDDTDPPKRIPTFKEIKIGRFIDD